MGLHVLDDVFVLLVIPGTHLHTSKTGSQVLLLPGQWRAMNDLTFTDLMGGVAVLLGCPVGQVIFAIFILVLVLSVPSTVKDHLDKLESEPYETYWSEKHQNKLVLWRGLYGLSLILFRFLPAVFAWGLLKAMAR